MSESDVVELDAPLGLEPRFAPSKGDVLPLDEGAILVNPAGFEPATLKLKASCSTY